MGSSDDTEPVDSADQDAWVNLAERLRARLTSRLKDIPKMKIDDIRILIDSIESVFWFHCDTLLFDKRLKNESDKAYFDMEK